MSPFHRSIMQEILFYPDRLYRWPYVRCLYRLHDRERLHIVCVMVVPLQNNNKRKVIVNLKVTVGMLVTQHPPHRSVHAVLPHTAPTSSIWRQSKLSDAPGPVHSTRSSGFVSGSRLPAPSSSWSASFPPSTPLRLQPHCSPTSQVICCRPTPRGMQPQAYGY